MSNCLLMIPEQGEIVPAHSLPPYLISGALTGDAMACIIDYQVSPSVVTFTVTLGDDLYIPDLPPGDRYEVFRQDIGYSQCMPVMFAFDNHSIDNDGKIAIRVSPEAQWEPRVVTLLQAMFELHLKYDKFTELPFILCYPSGTFVMEMMKDGLIEPHTASPQKLFDLIEDLKPLINTFMGTTSGTLFTVTTSD